eukprot:305059_1
MVFVLKTHTYKFLNNGSASINVFMVWDNTQQILAKHPQNPHLVVHPVHDRYCGRDGSSVDWCVGSSSIRLVFSRFINAYHIKVYARFGENSIPNDLNFVPFKPLHGIGSQVKVIVHAT